MPSRDRTDALPVVPTGRITSLDPDSIFAGSEHELILSDRFVVSGQFLLAYLLDGSAGPGDVAWLPVELQRVRQLLDLQRQCFVLRILAGWPREKCAAELKVPVDKVDEELGEAALCLARFVEN